MTLDLMREYIVFAKHLNFSHAALELNLTQSTLSKHIAALEKELGFPVVTRGRELQFTAQGKAFLESAQKVVHLYDAELSSLKESSASNKGPVRLYEGMARWTKFLDSVSDIPITFVEMRAGESVIGGMEKGRMDIGCGLDFSISPHMKASAAGKGIETMRLASIPMGILMSRNHELARRKALSREDLQDRTFVVLDGAFFDETSAFTSTFFGQDLGLRFSIVPISGSLANIDYLDLGDKLLLYSREILEALCERRDDLARYSSLDGVPLEAPMALYYRKDESDPDTLRLIACARQFFSLAS